MSDSTVIGWPLRWAQLEVLLTAPLVALLMRSVGWQRCQRLLVKPGQWAPAASAECWVSAVHSLEPGRWYRGPLRPRCLARSLTLQAVLARRGLMTELRLGVARSDAALAAHAWLECNGQALNESAPPESNFVVLPELQQGAAPR